MGNIKVFISHSSQDKQFAGTLKNYFRMICGFEAFCAHDDIPVANDFHEEIFKSMSKTDVVIALISKYFPDSAYANQEIGIAIASDKKIIPIKLDDTNPPGFINRLQAYNCKSDNADMLLELATTTFFILYESDKFIKKKERIIDSVLDAFLKSNSFKTSNQIIHMLLKINTFSESQITSIVNAIQVNPQINGEPFKAHALPMLQHFLTEKYHIDFPS
ncbi:MAG: toll/interleukin-1 receptor domain-containing protein [bacterium]|nr:toll/interleukin-1 receptor domain-containing protein [bacterium]